MNSVTATNVCTVGLAGFVVGCAGLLVKLSQCFSVVRNIELLSVRSVKSLPFIDALRVISFAVLIFGQTALAMFQSSNLG